MTNQEPGAPEPLTGLREGEEWRHRPAAILHWSPVAPGDPTECVVCPETWPCQAERVRAALSHPESDTRRCRCELTATGSGADPNCAIHGLHPESDTRGLDVDRLAVALMGSAVGTCHHHPAWTEEAAAAQARRLAAAYLERKMRRIIGRLPV